MPNTTFQIDGELNVQGKGSLTEAANDLGALTLGNCLTGAIGVYQNIDREYKKALANDGKIVGKERGDILIQVDMFIDMLLIMLRILDEEKRRENAVALENKNSGFYLNIRERNNLWEAEGKLSPMMVRPVKNFRTIYNNKLAPEIVDLLKNYSLAIEDGVLDIHEIQELKGGARQVLYYALFLRFQVEQCLVST